jgi:hypothetical protein
MLCRSAPFLAIPWSVGRTRPQGWTTNCGRICLGRKKINLSTVFAGQAVGVKEVQEDI